MVSNGFQLVMGVPLYHPLSLAGFREHLGMMNRGSHLFLCIHMEYIWNHRDVKARDICKRYVLQTSPSTPDVPPPCLFVWAAMVPGVAGLKCAGMPCRGHGRGNQTKVINVVNPTRLNLPYSGWLYGDFHYLNP